MLAVENPFVTLGGTVETPAATAPFEITLRQEDFTLPEGTATLEFRMSPAAVSQLDPAPVFLLDSTGAPVFPIQVSDDIDSNGTILHLLGLDHEQLTFNYQGRPFRLTDVHGKLIEKMLV